MTEPMAFLRLDDHTMVRLDQIVAIEEEVFGPQSALGTVRYECVLTLAGNGVELRVSSSLVEIEDRIRKAALLNG